MLGGDRGLDGWFEDITGEDLSAAQSAVSAYEQLCAAARDEMFARSGPPEGDVTSQWLALMSLGARVVGDLVKKSVATQDAARRESIDAIGRAIQAASSQLSHRSMSKRGSNT